LSSSATAGGAFRAAYASGIEYSTVATWLHARYATGFFGKYLNDYPNTAPPHYIPPGWDDWHAFWQPAYIRYVLEENGDTLSFGSLETDYSTDVLRDRAVRFLRKSPEPFFAYVAPFAPHNPFSDPVRYAGAFGSAQYPKPPSFAEEDVSDKPAWIRALSRDTAAPNFYFRHKLRALAALDDLVDSVVIALATRGVLDHSLIIFTSDNGIHSGEHRMRLDKGTTYEEDLRVPMLIRGPGVPVRTLNQIVLNIDLAPTIAAFARTGTPAFVDGRSLRPLLLGNANSTRSSFLVEVPNDASEYVQMVAVRTVRWKYVELASGERELYDLDADPWELRNVARGYPGVRAILASRLAALRSCAAAGYRAAENGR
jgi:arylsulfatase A-like enzyme